MNARRDFEQALMVERVASRVRLAMEHDSPEALAKYLKEHPDADKAKHTVKKPDGAKAQKNAPKQDSKSNDDAFLKMLSKSSPHKHRDKAMDAEKAGRHDMAAHHYSASAEIFKHRGDHAAAKSMEDAAAAATRKHQKSSKK